MGLSEDMNKGLIGIVVCLIFSASNVCCEEYPIDAAMDKAMDADPSTGGQTQAIAAALKQWDDELNRHYRTLTKQLEKPAAEALRESQRKWIEWRDLELKSLRAFQAKFEGTMWVPGGAYAEMKLTRERALQLKRMVDLLPDRG